MLLEQQNDVEILKGIRQALEVRITNLKQWVEIGRSRASEESAARAQFEQVNAQIEQVLGQEATARQLLEFLTGKPVGDIMDSPQFPPVPSRLDSYLGKAHLRPDVQAAEEAERVAEKQVSINKAGYWPNAALQGDYYTQRYGISSGIDWDAALLVDVPIFKGGQTEGQVDQAKSQLRQAHLETQLALRSSEQDIRDAYVQLDATLKQETPLENAFKAADESYQGQLQDYRHSRANNIDVLASLQTLENARRDFVRAQSEIKRLYWRLMVATGETL